MEEGKKLMATSVENYRYCIENNERLRLINNANKVAMMAKAKPLLKTHQITDIEKNQLLVKIFKRFVKKIGNKVQLLDNEILILANKEAQVLDFVADSIIPDFLLKNELKFVDWSTKTIGANAIGLAAEHQVIVCVKEEEHLLSSLQKYLTIAVPIFDDNHLVGILGLVTFSGNKEKALKLLEGLVIGYELLLGEEREFERLEREIEKRDVLYTITQKLYSTFDVNEVLSEAINSINLFYPNNKLELWLTHDYFIPNVSIKLINIIPDKNDINGKAFLEGSLIISDDANELAAPIKGKQGIYGVIHLSCSDHCDYDDEKVRFISSIAEIIGTAFENANLYQQSINSVRELQLINELTKQLNRSLDKEEILKVAISELEKIFKTHHVFVVQANKRKFTLVAHNENIDNITTIPLDYGYMGYVYSRKEPVIFSDIKKDQYIDDQLIHESKLRSLIAVPIIAREEIIGILSVASKQPNYFSYEDLRILQLFTQHLGLALTNSLLHGKIQRLAVTDYLTKLYNRSYLDTKIEESQKKDKYGSLLLFDIDDFKKINDSYGHQVGDRVLNQVAKILKSSIREEDIAARWGGEELAIYLPKMYTEIAVQIGGRITERVKNETNPRVTVSCGIATWEADDSDISYLSLVRKADHALYNAKNSGKNQVRVYDEEKSIT
ncbi:hypothetical protein BHF71_09740 [Vulcanibacillus modesticaldus]|uniref:GGDEF domain-containing protein n=1 Tax=Vulcanibacillus modesticaldus TaxID=337097 RepID=A0A1D2YU27_9BACI|nr:diguanylate cyclase [Vulcanibacillus modesticaldus]OEF99186.1 hypothetical protein BHF71_09740 [Vulcanibacillus modesticaldus]